MAEVKVKFVPDKPIGTPRLKVFLLVKEDLVELNCQDMDGAIWYIGEIRPNGKLRLCSGLPYSIGLDIDARGCITIEHDCG